MAYRNLATSRLNVLGLFAAGSIFSDSFSLAASDCSWVRFLKRWTFARQSGSLWVYQPIRNKGRKPTTVDETESTSNRPKDHIVEANDDWRGGERAPDPENGEGDSGGEAEENHSEEIEWFLKSIHACIRVRR